LLWHRASAAELFRGLSPPRTGNRQQCAKETPSETQPSEQDPITAALEKGGAMALDPFVVNLADADSARYLRIKVSLMVDDKTKMAELQDNQALQVKLRDVILQTLTQKTAHDISNEEGKNKLRHEIQTKIEDISRIQNLWMSCSELCNSVMNAKTSGPAAATPSKPKTSNWYKTLP
jgi:flagellar FliL protein